MDAGEKVEKPCIFETLLAPADGYVIPTPGQVKDEAYSILNAASDTAGNAMTVATYNVVNNREIYRTLTAELKAAFPNPDDKLEYLKLEKLPYLVSDVVFWLSVANIGLSEYWRFHASLFLALLVTSF